MNLINLPPEILAQIPFHLRNIQDFIDASSSCRTLYITFSRTPPSIILRLAATSSRELFRPHPHYLIAATVRQVGEWARLRPQNTLALQETFENGIDALFDLCVRKSSITLDEIRRLHAFRYTTINPVVDLVDRCTGPQWLSTPNFWNGGVSDAETVYCEPQRTLYQYVIYGELFSSAFREICQPLGPEPSPPALGLATRLDYIKYCIPDFLCMVGEEGFVVKYKGPYAKGRRSFVDEAQPSGDQVAVNHLISSSKWNQKWAVVRSNLEPELGSLRVGDWRHNLWCSMLQTQGLDSLEMLRPGGVEKWKPRLLEIGEKFANLEDKFRPKESIFGSLTASEAPNLLDEVILCCRRQSW